MIENDEMAAVLEAILFVTSEPVAPEKMLEVFPARQRGRAAEVLEAVLERYQARDTDRGRGIMLDRAGGGLRLVTRPELHGYLKTFFELTGRTRLSMAALETLAIVAYRQPITAPEVQELRGKSSSGVLKTLLERRLIRISGRKDVVGKPFLYATTRDFLLHFGLQSIADLPPLEEFEEGLLASTDFPLGEGAGTEDHEEEVLRQLALVEDSDDEVES